MRPGGAAALSGQVFVKDIIVAINGKEVKHFAGHDEMVAEITVWFELPKLSCQCYLKSMICRRKIVLF